MKLFIVDDHPMIRKGLMSVLSTEDNIEEIREASSAAEAMRVLSNYEPDLAIVDLRLGKDDGLDVVHKAKQLNNEMKSIILTSSSRKEDFLRAQHAGVDGYILKDAFTEDIIYALNVVSRGKKFFETEMLEHNSLSDDGLKDLTPREKEVLSALGKGLSNIQIAKRLFISENTVKKHISSILGKLDLNHRLEAVVYVNNSLNYWQ